MSKIEIVPSVIIYHIASQPDEKFTQRCLRCRKIIVKGGNSFFPPASIIVEKVIQGKSNFSLVHYKNNEMECIENNK